MRKSKKFLIVIFAALAATSLAACSKADLDKLWDGNQKVEYPVIETEISMSLGVTSRNLVVGDTYLLQPTYTKTDGFSFTYTSSDESVATVSDLGLVTAQNEGTATIKAVYSDGKKSIESSMTISSDFGAYLPEARLANINDEISVFVGKDFKLNPYVTFNGASFNDGEFAYQIEDTSIATVSGGKINAKKVGATSLIIKGEWRGKSVSESIPVTVCDEVVFLNDGAPVQDAVIYTVSSAGGVSYETSLPKKFSVAINGTTYSASGDVIAEFSNTNVAKGYGSKIVSVGYGDTVVKLSTNKGGVSASFSFTVTVKRPEVVISETVPMFATDYGTYLDSATKTRKNLLDFASVSDTLVDAYQDGKALTVSDGKVLGVASSNVAARGTANLVLGTKDVLYHFNLETVAKFFTLASDLYELQINSAGARGGYYELLNNIDASGISLSHSVPNENNCFNGVFDGNGYTIKNLSVDAENSIFGALGSGAVVKNAAFIDLSASSANYFAHTAGKENGLTFEQIYVKVSSGTVSPRGMVSYSGSGNIIKNVVIEYLGTNANKNRAYGSGYQGSFIMGMSRGQDEDLTTIIDKNNNWINVFVISPFVLGFSPTDGYVLNTQRPEKFHALYVLGANEDKDMYGNDTSGVSLKTRPSGITNVGWSVEDYYVMKLKTVYRCDTATEMAATIKAGKNDLTAFSSSYWNVTSGVPVWKNA